MRVIKIFIASLIFFSSCSIEKQPFEEIKLAFLNNEDQLIDFNNGNGNVFIFLTPDCPIGQKYSFVIEKLYQKYQGDGLSFYGIFPSNLGEKKISQTYAEDFDLSFPILKDPEQHLQRYFGATISPEVFLTDATGKVYYQGQIDNWFFDLGKKRQIVTEDYLDTALKAYTTQSDIKTKRTKAIGCYLPKL
ncbi:MAG: redoxin domain-containing protein [Bacteroidota bacterium]